MTLHFDVERYRKNLETIKINPRGSKALQEEIKIVNKYLRKV